MYLKKIVCFWFFGIYYFLYGLVRKYLGRCHWLKDSMYAHLKESAVSLLCVTILVIHYHFFLLNDSITEIDVLKLVWYNMVVLISLYNFIIFALNILQLFCYLLPIHSELLYIFGRLLLINMWQLFLSLLSLIFSVFFLILLK